MRPIYRCRVSKTAYETQILTIHLNLYDLESTQ